MTDHDVFDTRLGDALRQYAAEAPTQVDALAFAQSLIRDNRRRSGWRAIAGLSRMRMPMRWVVVASLLALAAAIALAAAGAWLKKSDLHPEQVVPVELSGDWEAEIAGSGTRWLDLNRSALVLRPDAVPLDAIGRAVAFTQVPSEFGTAGIVVISSSGACGVGRYAVALVDEELRITESADSCPERRSLFRAAPRWRKATQHPLAVGMTYGSFDFTEPFHFVMPGMDPNLMAGPEGVGNIRAFAHNESSKGELRIGYGCCWMSWLLDDHALNADVCDPIKGMLADVPSTPELVDLWLRSSSDLVLSDAIEVPVDGRTALRIDVLSTGAEPWYAGCDGSIAPTQPSILGGFRYYAIPTGDDTILYVVWSDPGSLPGVSAGADELVRSITFDESGASAP